MNTNEIWFEGNFNNTSNLERDIRKFPEGIINIERLKAKLL